MGNNGSSWKARAFLATLVTLSFTVPPPAVHAQAGPAPAAGPKRPLTISVGPRDGAWKRVFNPLLHESDTLWPSTAGIYEPLILYNRATGNYAPWLATRFDWSEKDTRLRFTLRPGVLWSDGAPFVAGDVAFTFNLLRRFPVLDRLKVWAFLQDVLAVNASTVEFVFKRPFTPGLVAIGHQPIVPEHKWKGVAQPAAFEDPNPVGTGPFTEVLRFEPTVYELGRNKKYWQAGKPKVDVLRFPTYHTNEAILQALEKGELDWTSVFLPSIEKSWVAKDPARRSYWYPDLGNTVSLYLNTQKKPFDDKNVRKAISMALDRPRIMAEAMSGYAPPADATGLSDSQKRWKDPAAQGATWTRRDLAQANKLLDAAGLARGAEGIRMVPGGAAMRYDIHTVTGWTDWTVAAGLIRQSLAEVGIASTVAPIAYHAWVDALQKGRFDMGIWSAPRGPTPYQFYRSQMDATLVRPLGEEASDNFHRFASAEASALLRSFEATSDSAELARLNGQLQKLYVEHAPSLPLFASPLFGVFNSARFSGFPGRFRPYGAADPGWPDALPVLVEVAPR
jgi:peptide/nickel transport system substrate-binding protein